MSLNQFIDTGADNATVNDMKKSIAREEDLQKAMNKAGLVQKEVQVKGKNGQMFTRKQWVKASDDAVSQNQQPKQQTNNFSDIDKKIAELKQKQQDVYDAANRPHSSGTLSSSDLKYLHKLSAQIKELESQKKTNAQQSSNTDSNMGKTLNVGTKKATVKTYDKLSIAEKREGADSIVSIDGKRYDYYANIMANGIGSLVPHQDDPNIDMSAAQFKPGDKGYITVRSETIPVKVLDMATLNHKLMYLVQEDRPLAGGASMKKYWTADYNVKPLTNSSKKDKTSSKLDPFQVGGNNVTHYINRKKFPPTGFSSASLAGKNIGEVLSGQSKEFVSKGAKDEAIRATKEAIRSHKRGLKDPNYRDSLYSESKEKQIIEAATELLAKLEEIPVRGQSQSKSDDKSTDSSSNSGSLMNKVTGEPVGSYKKIDGKNIVTDIFGQAYEVSDGDLEWLKNNNKRGFESRDIKSVGTRAHNYDEKDVIRSDETAAEYLARKGKSSESSDKFKPSDFQFRSGGQNVADFVNSIDKELGVKKHTNGNVGFGTLSLENGASVNFGYDDTGAYATWNGSNFRDVKSLKSAMSGQKSDQGKMNHQTGVRDKKAPTMIEDYFAGNHSHDDGKKALAGLLGKGYSREDIMEQAEKSGVTWKKNDHAGINWMRASMAIQKHLNNSSK